MRTTTRSPGFSCDAAITVGTFPCQSRKIVSEPVVKVCVRDWPISSRSARRLPPRALTVSEPEPTDSIVPRKR